MTFDPPKIRVVLFDVGGVLIELSGLAVMLSWLQNRVTPEQVYTIWLSSPTVRSFETGRMKPELFAERIIAELELPVGKEEFLAEFCRWPLKGFPGAVELVNRVPRKFVRATLCNTNALHWPALLRHEELLGGFDHHFASHLIGKIKPDEEAFRHVVDTLSCAPSEILFMDDSRVNIAGAKKVGIRAFQVRGPAEAEQVLQAHGVFRDNDESRESHRARIGAKV